MNEIILSGEVTKDCEFSHRAYNESFVTFEIGTLRKSMIYDFIPCVMSESFPADGIVKGARIAVRGEVRTRNLCSDDGKSHCETFVFVTDILDDSWVDENKVTALNIAICQIKEQRKTFSGILLTEFTGASHRLNNGRSDYLHCLAWSRHSNGISLMNIGDKIDIIGRLQSRTFKNASGEERTVLEVSLYSYRPCREEMKENEN